MSAQGMRQEQTDFAHTSFCRAGKMEYLLLCLQSVNAGNIVAWDVAFLPGDQGSSLPPLPRPEDRREQRSQGAERIPRSWAPQPWRRIAPPQEADRVRGRVTMVPAPSMHPITWVGSFATVPTVHPRV